MRVRKPAVAGYFYEADPGELRRRIEWAIGHELGPKSMHVNVGGSSALGAVTPHAGYIYSGPTAAWSYAALNYFGKPDTVIIVGPNHYGLGAPLAIYAEGIWETPLGSVEIDAELAKLLMDLDKDLENDPAAFSKEHSVEVQVPFIQFFWGGAKIVPIIVWRQTKSVSVALGKAIAKAVDKAGKRIYFIASSDLNHYEPHEITLEKDEKVIDAVLRLDVDAFFSAIERYDVSVCGIAPIAAIIVAASELGYTARLLSHTTSGDTSGDKTFTVGYASILVFR